MKWIVSAALFFASYLPLSAAEDTGSQQIVCHIAYEYLDDATKAKLETLSGVPVTKTTFLELCAKPLEIQGARAEKYKYLQDDTEGSVSGTMGQSAPTQLAIRATRNLPSIGYVDVPRDMLRIDNFECPQATTCLTKALMVDTQLLMGAVADAGERIEAVNRISWHIARLHFPFSFGFSDDLAGHWIRVGNTKSCARTLNDFWAKCSWKRGMVARKLDPDTIGEYAARLQKEIGPDDAQKWVSGTNLLAWANQSYRIATSSRMGYCIWQEELCRYSEEKLTFDPNNQLYDQYSRKVFVGRIEGVATQKVGVHNIMYKKLLLDDEYKIWAMEVMEKRLKQAGVRLAAFLAVSL